MLSVWQGHQSEDVPMGNTLLGMSLSCLSCVVEVSPVPAGGAGTGTGREEAGP